ncbi:TM2 domain-containing membrane protein YozV [Catenuloplanes nepalensis]|uniref:TM2 domain-containing membrane protein YozV n=1 Tax=Catenuloplanes nepalensis TaxID=587533 RepID=A0ABT9MKP5_9ACTN|nr:hypothetical protein [Catenuloplanes nepalensis]MDP9791997.1 TM2 domain-containing membrane protein YozV [Catenuloplanes nepalensis]
MYVEEATTVTAPVQAARFHHGEPDSATRHGPLSAITRCLSGAVYTVPGFADRVITELLQDRHRAVSPAVDYDVEPVLRHAFRARRLWLTQHAAVCAILLLAYIIASGPVLGLVCFGLLLTGAARWIGGRRPKAWQLVLAGLVALPLLYALIGPMIYGPAGTPTEYATAEEDTRSPYAMTLLIGLAVLIVTVAVRHTILRALTVELSPGHADRGAIVPSPRVEERIARLSLAQRGNILLHSGDNPFLGAGGVLRAWSMAMELKPDGDGDRPVTVDPAELNRFVKRRLAALRAGDLREAERMSGLTLRDQIVSAGVGGDGWPLVDTDELVPYSHATPAAMESVIRHPQASVRHFLRATVGANVTPVHSADGRMLIPGEHHSIAVSTFTHIAVEGGMLYVETVSTVLGPLGHRYRRIDGYPAGGGVAGRAVLESLRDFGENIALAPFRMAVTLYRMALLARALRRTEAEVTEEDLGDFGARFDLRQATSAARPVTYLQRLDAEKYTKLIERRISEAVIGYLRDAGIDTSEYERRMNVYNNSSVFISGDNYGAAAAGSEAQATKHDGDGGGSKKGKDD